MLLLIIRQGLVHPEQCIPYLITISTDPESTVRIKANQQLTEHSSRYGHFVQVFVPLVEFNLWPLTSDLTQTTLMAGVKKSSMFHNLLYGVRAIIYHYNHTQSVSVLSYRTRHVVI